jgi:hypothetical protein
VRTNSRPLELALAVLLLSSTGACATGMRPQHPEGGTLTVGVTTAGTTGSSLTFRVRVASAGIDEAVKADAGVLTKSGLPWGDHVVRLFDLPERCRADGPAERTVTISPQRRSAALRFHVVCS